MSVTSLSPDIAARLRRNADGLLPAIVQQHDTGEVLMLAWMDDEALHRTLTTGAATYWSRSRREYWVKGATSGTASAWSRLHWIVTETHSWSGSTRPVRPATPVTTRASTPGG